MVRGPAASHPRQLGACEDADSQAPPQTSESAAAFLAKPQDVHSEVREALGNSGSQLWLLLRIRRKLLKRPPVRPSLLNTRGSCPSVERSLLGVGRKSNLSEFVDGKVCGNYGTSALLKEGLCGPADGFHGSTFRLCCSVKVQSEQAGRGACFLPIVGKLSLEYPAEFHQDDVGMSVSVETLEQLLPPFTYSPICSLIHSFFLEALIEYLLNIEYFSRHQEHELGYPCLRKATVGSA